MSQTAATSEARFATDSAAGQGAAEYLFDRRELDFLLWEQLQIDRRVLGHAPYQSLDRAKIGALIDAAQSFAAKLAAANRESDRHGARLGADGKVILPPSYTALWQEFCRDWSWIRRMGERASIVSASQPALGPIPPIVVQIISELFMGANAAFMTYGGFTAFAMRLIEQHGTERQKNLFLQKLANDEWDACYCATETQAGSDLTAIATSASPVEDELYAITGHKRYITAGMHDLTGNTVHVVLGRVEGQNNAFALSCFLVPRFWPDEDGVLRPNHVSCAQVADKMGLNGCANTYLEFGRQGRTLGFLLGNRSTVALPQLMTLMRAARISTGQFGIAMASSAYLHSLRHARARIQGRRFEESADAKALPVPIVEHLDVQRMLLDMRTKVEGCRGLIARLVMHMTRIEQLAAAEVPDAAAIDRERKMVLLYTPVVKAYVSDEAWDIATTAIQVHGGEGYMRHCPVEQYARDIKVLSIWEGTNYMQAQDFVRDKLGYGRQSQMLRIFNEDLHAFLARAAIHPALAREFAILGSAADAFARLIAHVRELAERGAFTVISQYCTRLLKAFGELVLGWCLLEGASAAEDAKAAARRHESDMHNELPYYTGKIKAARFYMHNTLSAGVARMQLMCRTDDSFTAMEADEFGFAGSIAA